MVEKQSRKGNMFLFRKGRITMKSEELLATRNFITPKEFCEVYDGQISVTTVNLLIRKGRIPCSKMGHKNLIPVLFVRSELSKGAE